MIVVVATVLAAVLVALNSSAAHPGAVPTTTRPPTHHATLPFTSSPAITQPPVTTTPLAPGVPVNSDQNESDPFVPRRRGHYYLYTSNTTPNFTTNAGMNVPVASSTDFATWGPVTDAMPVLPPWGPGELHLGT